MENEVVLNLEPIGKGLLAIGALGSAIGVANIFSAYLTGVARNPEAKSFMFGHAIIGAALAELMGLLCVVMMFIL